VKIVKSILKKLISLWTVYGGIALSLVIAWWTNFTKNKMDLWTAFLTLTITCIGLLTFVKSVVLKRKQDTSIESMAMIRNRNAHSLDKVISPEENSKELGELIIHSVKEGKEIMSKIGKFLKLLWGNKYTLASIISNLAVTAFAQFLMYSDMLNKYEFFVQHTLAFRIAVTVLCALWLIDNIFCVVTKYGLESLGDLKERSEKKKQEAIEKLTPEQKATFKNTLVSFKEKHNELINSINGLVKDIEKFKKVVADFELLQKYNIASTSEQEANYNDARNQLVVLINEKQSLENQKTSLEHEMAKVKERL